jgi:chromosomal replication initiation ATPase DnaA
MTIDDLRGLTSHLPGDAVVAGVDTLRGMVMVQCKSTDLADRTYSIAAEVFGVALHELRSRNRHQAIAEARHAVAFALRKFGLTTHAIGILMHRDHGSACNSHRKCMDRMDTDGSYRRKVDELIRRASQ